MKDAVAIKKENLIRAKPISIKYDNSDRFSIALGVIIAIFLTSGYLTAFTWRGLLSTLDIYGIYSYVVYGAFILINAFAIQRMIQRLFEFNRGSRIDRKISPTRAWLWIFVVIGLNVSMYLLHAYLDILVNPGDDFYGGWVKLDELINIGIIIGSLTVFDLIAENSRQNRVPRTLIRAPRSVRKSN
jgi:hypothetical protein